MEDEDSDVEPPAGITFANIKELNFPTSFSMTTDIISKPYNQNELHTHDRQKRLKKRFHIFRKKFDETRLRILANSGYLKQLVDFLETCPDIETVVNRSDDKGRTALHFAASQGYDQIVHELLKHSANPNLQDFNGNTPLHLAACTQHVRVVTLLIHFGADVSKKDTFGKTPLHVSLSRLRMLQAKPFVNTSYGAAKRKADVCEIVAMLQEYFDKSGQTEEQLKLSEINKKLMDVHTYEEVDEVGSLLFNFTQMNIDVEKR